MDRRSFIKLTAVTGTGVGLASCGNPEHQLIRFVPDEDIAPGIAEWKPSVCPACAAGCGVNVRVMDADVDVVRNGQAGVVSMNVAKKLEGNPKDPISRGGLCARGQASIQITYHPDRLTQPMKRSGARGSGQFAPVSWDEAIGELVSKLDALAAAGDQKSLVYMMRRRSDRRAALASAFLETFGAPGRPLVVEVCGDEVLRRANAMSFGREQLPTIDLARAHFVLSFGADFLGTWNSPVAQSAAYGVFRQGRPNVRGRFVQVESRMTQTGANADDWIPAKPGTDGALALGLAHVIMAAKLRPSTMGHAAAAIDGWSAGLADYAPDKVEQLTGVRAARIERLAHELVEQAPSVAIVGGPALAHSNALAAALAVNALNELLGAVEQPGGLFFTAGWSSAAPAAGSRADAAAGLAAAKVLLLDEANPVYGSPRAAKVRETIANVPFIASFGSFIDDTSVHADLLLPDHSFLESWVDAAPESGSIEAAQASAGPVMKPIHDTRATADVLIAVAGKLKSPVALPWKSAEDLAKANTPDAAGARPSASPKPQAPSSVRLDPPRFEGDAAQYPFHFLPFRTPQFGDGSTAHLPWLQEMPDPMTSAMWSSWIEINPSTAAKLGIGQGDIVEVRSPHGTLRAPAMIFPAIAPDIVAMPIGQGHTTFTQYASGRGANPIEILAPAADAQTGALAWAATRVTIARVGDPDRSLVMFAGEMREHPHEGEIR